MKKIFVVCCLLVALSSCARTRHMVYLSNDKNVNMDNPDVVKEYFDNGVYGKNIFYVHELCKQGGFNQALAFSNRTPSIAYSIKRLLGVVGYELETTEIWCKK